MDLPPGPPAQPALFQRLGPAGPLALVAAVCPLLGSIVLFATASRTAPWLRELGSSGPLLFAGAFIALAGLALLPTYALSAFAGYVFGLEWGAPAALIGCLGGSLVGYVTGRAASGEHVAAVIAENAKARAIRESLVGKGPWRTFVSVVLLRLPPNSPFALMNLVMASVRVPLLPYAAGTILGIAPRTVLAVLIGAGVDKFSKDSLKDAAPPWVLYVGIGVTAAVVLAVWVLVRRTQRASPHAGSM